MKVALIHDHLCQEGGAEKVLEVFSRIFPKAPIFTLTYEKNKTDKNFPGRSIRPSIIQKIPGGISHYRWFMPVMPMAIEFFDLREFDVVLSSTSSFAKGVITSPNALHICYCHTPTRYLWSDTHQYINDLKYNKYFKKVISLALNYVRIWDKLAADRVDFYLSEKQEDYYLAGCRLVPYKKIDIMIEAFLENGLPLKIFGDGIDRERLQAIAGEAKNIEFLGRVTDKEKSELYSKCRAFINPQLEDFGITPVEAMASGRPVIALGEGGSLESIVDGETGVFFKKSNKNDLNEAIKRLNGISFDSQKIRQHAKKFSEENFIKQIKETIEEEYKKFNDKCGNYEDWNRY